MHGKFQFSDTPCLMTIDVLSLQPAMASDGLKYFSFPVDDDDPWIRHACDDHDRVLEELLTFTASQAATAATIRTFDDALASPDERGHESCKLNGCRDQAIAR